MKGKQIYNLIIARKFALWAKDKISDVSELNETHIKTFLDEYGKEHELRNYTITTYYYALKRFVNFIKDKNNFS